ncbi:MAG TPA: hypothetical protein VHL11_12275 [Phototrophicaceae bacterium]|jgi:hypothetical protein|nr:hypothetical protein [Phototrophicaceae bacterium]
MASIAQVAPTRIKGYPADSLRFDWLMTGLSFLFILGLHLDGWAHNHGQVDNSFFTPWHAVLYSAFGLVGLALVVTQFRNVSQGYSFTKALPRGYGLALIGVAIFAAAGAGDFVWHSVFGFEAKLATLMSPAHLALATGAFLFLSAPLRAAWHRKNLSGWRDLFPVVATLTFLLALFAFFVQYNGYLDKPEWIINRSNADDGMLQIFRFTSVFIQSALFSGLVLFALRRWQLPVGTMTFMLGVTTLLYFWVRHRFIVDHALVLAAPFIAGILLDGLLWTLHPSVEKIGWLRLFAFLMPFVLTLSYFGVLMAAYRISWSVHLWLGLTFFAGIIGLFMSYLVFPPIIEPDAE